MLRLWKNENLSVEDRLKAAGGEIERLHVQISSLRDAHELNVQIEIRSEREACAKLCDSVHFCGYVPPEDGAAADYYNEGAQECAEIIRSRSNDEVKVSPK